MASLLLCLVKGNAATPDVDDGIGIHAFMGALEAWDRGEITRLQVITAFGLLASDEADLDLLKSWYVGATDRPLFLRVLKDRLYMAEDKTGGTDGYLGYAVKTTLINGANGTTPLSGL